MITWNICDETFINLVKICRWHIKDGLQTPPPQKKPKNPNKTKKTPKTNTANKQTTTKKMRMGQTLYGAVYYYIFTFFLKKQLFCTNTFTCTCRYN